MYYTNRSEAGFLLARKLAKHRNDNSIVLAVPRGGVPVGCVIAQELGLYIDIVSNISCQGMLANNSDDDGTKPMPPCRDNMCTGNMPPVSLGGKTVIIADDGATASSTMIAVIDMTRKLEAAKVVVAIPVTAPSSAIRLMCIADELACLSVPKQFHSAEAHYHDFKQLSDDEVLLLLRHMHRQESIKQLCNDKNN